MSSLFDEVFSWRNRYTGTDRYEGEVFVSYNWESDGIVDDIERAFVERGIQITRDKKDLPYRGSIKAFEQRLGRGQWIVLVISDKYLRSKNCMYELVEIERNDEFRERIFPIVLEDAKKIYQDDGLLEYIDYWGDRFDDLDRRLRENKITRSKNTILDLEKIEQIKEKCDDLIGLIRDMNTLNPELLAENDYILMINAVELAMNEIYIDAPEHPDFLELDKTPDEYGRTLGITARSFIKQMSISLDNGDFSNTREYIRILKRIAQKEGINLEIAEISLECAYAHFKMGDYRNSVPLFLEAITRYDDENVHNRAIASWLLGDAYREIAKETTSYDFWEKAFSSWQRGYNIFLLLSSRKREPEWYTEKSGIMRKAIEARTVTVSET